MPGHTAEHCVADASGVVCSVRAIRRMPVADHWSSERVRQITGVPDDPGCEARVNAPELRTEPEIAPAPTEAQEPTDREG